MTETRDFNDLLREYEDGVGRPQAGMTLRPNEFRQVDEEVPRQRLQFQAPPPLAAEPKFSDSIESALGPFRQQFDAAREILARQTEEATQALQFRNDLERAAASVRNVTADHQPRESRPHPDMALKMDEQSWNAYKRRVENGEAA